ncbi:MAG: alpha/beta hydrolase [Parvularculaceae bacterium]
MIKSFWKLAVLPVLLFVQACAVAPVVPQIDPPSDYLTAKDHFIMVDGLRVRIRDEGPRHAPVILLMHGFIYSLETWDHWAAALKNDYRVIRFDLAGHGLTGPDPQKRYSPTERAAFVGAVLDALHIRRAIVGGNSLGGLAAWRFAAMAPARVSALVLVAPAAYPANGVDDKPAAVPDAMKAFLLTAPDAGIDITLKRIFSDDTKVTPEMAKRMGEMMRRPGNGDAYIQSIEEFTLPDPADDLAKIKAPTLLLWGADDIVIPVEEGRRMEEAIKGAKLIIYPGVGHAPQEEAPEQTVGDVEKFLEAAGLR